MDWQNDPDWRDRYLLRFKQRPSQKLMEFINTEIALAIQRKRLPPPMPPKAISKEEMRATFMSLAILATDNKEEQDTLYQKLCQRLER